jgi:hypothetical protein
VLYVTRRARVPKIGVANPTSSLEALVDADLDTLVTAPYVKIDDMLVKDRRPGHPARLTDSCQSRSPRSRPLHSD